MMLLRFLSEYVEMKVFNTDPFVSIDPSSVGKLVEISSNKGKKANNALKLVYVVNMQEIQFYFLFKYFNIDYISCSPYRIPAAKLAAAQAQLNK
jgi:pyruvate,orthophosphate dikinase